MKNQKFPKATHEGKLKIAGADLDVAVLDNQSRIISHSAVFKALGRPIRGTERVVGIPPFMDAKNLQDLVTDDLASVMNKVEYLGRNGKRQEGYDANILPLVCDLYLQGRANGTITRINQLATAQKAEILVRSLAKVGINALVDEATGYQDVRVKDALQKILDQYLLQEAKRYEVTFPLELYKQWFRLNGWQWRPENAQKRPGIIGKWTNKYIYSRMAPGLLDELERKNPKNAKGYREFKHFSFLTDEIGEPKLREFFGGLIALAKASTTWNKYTSLIERAYPAIGDQYKIFHEEEMDG